MNKTYVIFLYNPSVASGAFGRSALIHTGAITTPSLSYRLARKQVGRRAGKLVGREPDSQTVLF